MTLNIAHYKVANNSGKIAQSGGNSLSFKSNTSVLSDLYEAVTIFGTPITINRAPLNSYAHMMSNYIQIVRNTINPVSNQDQLFIPDRLRIKIIGGVCVQSNMILYAWSASPTKSPYELRWQVLFANCNAQPRNTFIDIDLPDSALYPSLYLSLILIDGGFSESSEVDSSQNIYSCPGNLPFYCINPAFNVINPNERHMIASQGINTINGYYSRVVVAFEDLPFLKSDRDYNDVVLSLSSVFFDETHTNDTTIS